MRNGFFFLIFFISCISMIAQVGIGTDNPDVSSILDIVSSDKGVLIPRVALQSETDEITIDGPANSLLVYNTYDDNGLVAGFYYWSATKEKWLLLMDTENASSGSVWYKQNAGTAATVNTDNIYVQGGVVIGKDMENDENEDVVLEVAGALRSGDFSFSGSEIIGINSAAFGENTVAEGHNSVAIGYLSKAKGINNFAGGGSGRFTNEILENIGIFLDSLPGAKVSGQSNFGFGPGVNVDGFGSLSIGFLNESRGLGNVSLGGLNVVTENNLGLNYALGLGNQVTGGMSFALGFMCEASAGNTYAIGDGVKATANGAFAFGYQTEASGKTSTVFGEGSIASGTVSTAFGSNSRAKGTLSSTFGHETIASHYAETVMGHHNAIISWADHRPLLQIGNGDDSNNRSNAFTVKSDGWTGIGVWQQDGSEKLYVNGSIKTASTTYADYVFEDYFENHSIINPSYKFKTIEEIKAFIEENRHLPGILPASELKRNKEGQYVFNLTNLAVRSLEKIEELFIHVIEQQSDIETVNNKLKILESQNLSLQQQNEELKVQNEINHQRLQRLEALLWE